MKVILIKDVGGLGKRDTVKEVADGFALNSLIPQGKAVQATSAALVALEKRTTATHASAAIQHAHQEALLNKLKGAVITLKDTLNERGNLYHQVTTFQITNELNHTFHTNIGAESIVINDPIKEKGEHAVEVHLAGKVVTVKVVIVGK